MLIQLNINNYALIQELSFAPSKSLNTITGETGAGKSIILGALGLILGNRADSKALLEEKTKCVIEATFDISNYHLNHYFEEQDLDYYTETIIRREISPSGKSRAFVNDTPVTLDVLKELGGQLIDIHSQHDTQFLKKKDIQLLLIDAYANSNQELDAYKKVFASYLEQSKKLHKLQNESKHSQEDLDYNKHLLEELKGFAPIANEDEELEKNMNLVDNVELIKTNLFNAQSLLSNEESGAENGIYDAISCLKEIAALSSEYEKLLEKLNNTLYELKDLTAELETANSDVDFDPIQAQETKERYDQLQRLLRKHNCTSSEELLSIQDELENKVNGSINLDSDIEELELELKQTEKRLSEAGTQLTKKRSNIFNSLASQIETHIKDLGIPDAQFIIDHKTIEASPSGFDAINFLFSANKGRTPSSLQQAASGGEMSRLMFVLKRILADKVSLPTIIFDEIDTGISGEIAMQMGKMMESMSQSHQLMCITHLPQIAAKGKAQFYVYKDKSTDQTATNIKQLAQEDRLNEIAQMIGGKSPSSTAIESARELLGY